MAVSNEFIEEVRSRNDIVAVAGEYINLKKSGRNYNALCPFHNEKTPSFMVSPEKQIFHCFGCQLGGNVFTFVMKLENLSFMEAVEKLAKRVGLTVPAAARSKEAAEKNKERESLYAANELAAKYYEYGLKELSEAKIAQSYLQQRGLSAEVIKKFRIGYAPQSGDKFLKAALSKGLNPEVLQKAGLVNYNERYYDYFRGRVMYPICDAKGKVVAFGARTLDDAKQPKYLNSAETPLFSKSKLLYGLNLASNAIRKTGQVLLLEGYMDVIACHQFGLENSIASMGVALTPEQIELVKRYCGKIVIIYDSDQAGVAATLRGLDLLVDSGLEVKVAVQTAAKDPDEFLHKQGCEAFEAIVQNALSLIEYRLEQSILMADLKTVQGKVFVVNEILPLIARIRNIVEQKAEVHRLAQRLNLNEETLFSQLEKIADKGFRKKVSQSIQEETSAENGFIKAQHNLVQLFLSDARAYQQWQDQISPEDITDPNLKIILAAMAVLNQKQQAITPSEIIDYLQNELLTGIIAKLAFSPAEGLDVSKLAGELIHSIKNWHKKERYKILAEEISRKLDAEGTVDPELMKEYKDLTQIFKGSRN
ncbi:MAG: DNA primase [bacterium]|nr:DNA primase [bacterium]MDD5354067.1 DNA primase [bacterium]MDD5756944.1 DNA primase [bacterium]